MIITYDLKVKVDTKNNKSFHKKYSKNNTNIIYHKKVDIISVDLEFYSVIFKIKDFILHLDNIQIRKECNLDLLFGIGSEIDSAKESFNRFLIELGCLK